MGRNAPLGLALVAAALASGGSAGCERPSPGADAGSAPGFTVHDSAGIEIVENHAPEQPPGQFWTIDRRARNRAGRGWCAPGRGPGVGRGRGATDLGGRGDRPPGGRAGCGPLPGKRPALPVRALRRAVRDHRAARRRPRRVHAAGSPALSRSGYPDGVGLLVYRNELFRHRRGAPPGALLQHPGADGPGSRSARRFRVPSASRTVRS